MEINNQVLQDIKTYYQDEYITISMSKHEPLIFFKAKGLPRDSDHFRDDFNYMLDFIFQQSKTHTKLFVFGDLREVQTVTDEDMLYLYETFYPTADQSNIKKIALLTPVSVFSQIALELLYSKIKVTNMIVRVFGDSTEALVWLQE